MNRLAELGGGLDVEAGTSVLAQAPPGTFGSNTTTSGFLAEVATIRAQLAEITRHTKQIESLHQSALVSISKEDSGQAAQHLEKLTKDTNTMAGQVKNRIQALDDSTRDLEAQIKRDPSIASASDVRMRRFQTNTLSRKLVEAVTTLEQLQTEYKSKYEDRVRRQYRIVKPEASQDEVEEVVQGGPGQEIFTQQILQQPGHAAAQKALADIEEKTADILRLERTNGWAQRVGPADRPGGDERSTPLHARRLHQRVANALRGDGHSRASTGAQRAGRRWP